MNSSGNTTRHRILTALLIVLFSASCASQKPPIFDPDVDVFTLFSGEWGNSNEHSCSKNAHRISFTDGGKKAVFEYQHPPIASSDVSYLPIESQSPEVSTDDTIVFNVLDHGDTWLILRRENETRRGTNGQLQAWKIYLSRDQREYRWWLHGSVAWKKSLVVGIRCEPSEFNENEMAESRADPVLKRFLGDWVADGHVQGERIRYAATGRAVLQGKFVVLTLSNLMQRDSYAATIFIGRSDEKGDYIAHWLDTTGADGSRVVGSGMFQDEVLSLSFPYESGTFIDHFQFHRDGSFDLQILSQDGESGAEEEFANYRFSQALP